MIFSCKECADRKIGCHSNCSKYKNEKAEYDRRRDDERVNRPGRKKHHDIEPPSLSEFIKRKR